MLFCHSLTVTFIEPSISRTYKTIKACHWIDFAVFIVFIFFLSFLKYFWKYTFSLHYQYWNVWWHQQYGVSICLLPHLLTCLFLSYNQLIKFSYVPFFASPIPFAILPLLLRPNIRSNSHMFLFCVSHTTHFWFSLSQCSHFSAQSYPIRLLIHPIQYPLDYVYWWFQFTSPKTITFSSLVSTQWTLAPAPAIS